MITIFACPKSFHGHIGIIQRNAIKSWTLLEPRPEIILLGIDAGTSDICQEFGLIHIPKIYRNDYGTPLINSIFQVAQEKASQSIVCYINSDIILMNDFMRTAKIVIPRLEKFLILGQRWDADIIEELRFNSEDWEKNLRAFIEKKGKLHEPNGIDYFCFPRHFYNNIPPFAIGRFAWDNWLVWKAWANRIPIVDVTDAVMAVHQTTTIGLLRYKN